MMQENVCIVLNERESLKKNMAEALEAKLAKSNITSTRLPIDHNIEAVILEQGSRIFIFDYLLGNYTTGLDILYKLSVKYQDSVMPSVIFLTDEPSVQAAVSAIKLGAKDYIQIDNPQALEQTLNVINDCLTTDKITVEEQIEFIGESPAFQTLSTQIKSLSNSSHHIIVIEGADGCGKNTVANLILQNKQSSALIKTYDLRFFDDSFESLIDSNSPLRLGDNLSIIANNCSGDHDELLNLISNKQSQIWKNNQSFLVICTSSHDTARAWLNLTSADYVLVPNLKERKDDIPILCQHFITKLMQLQKQHNSSSLPKLLNEFCTTDWEGGVSELKSVLTYCYTKKSDENSIADDIEEGKLLWKTALQASQPSEYLDHQTVYKTLEESNFHHRIAAAKLGCSIQTIKKVLTQEVAV